MRPNICLLTVLVCLSSPPPSRAQTKPAPAAPTALDAVYDGESFVVEKLDSVIEMKADGTGFRENTMVVRVQSEAALRQLGVLTAPFASASERVEIQFARVRRPDGTVVETPVGDALEQPEPVTVQAPFYSDLKQKQLPIKSLRVGDTLEWKVRVVRIKAEAPGQFWGQETFSENIVSLSESVTLRIPKDSVVNVWTNPRLTVKPVETIVGEQRVIRWDHSSPTPTTGKAADEAREKKKKTVLTPDEDLDAREGKLPSLAFTTFKSWQQVGEWYRSLAAERALPDAQVKAKVAEITAGKISDEEKVRAVYAFVSTQVRYIGVSFGVGRYQPHPAGEVLDNQYGDCKDKHTLLAAMLVTLGMHPDAVLIGSQIRFNEAVPSPASFNHLITRVDVDGQPIWLDSTQEVAPYRMLLSVLRGKPALRVPALATSAAAIERTPKDPPFAPFQKFIAIGTLTPDGTSNSRLTLTTRGDDELALREVLHQIAPAQYSELVQRLVTGMGYAGVSSHPELGRPEDTADPLVISYDYKREKNGDWDNLKIIPQLLPVYLPVVDEKEPPVQSIELGSPRIDTSNAELKLPPGWGVELPEAIHQKSDFATLDQTYRFEKGIIYSERKVVILRERLPATEWKSYKKWADAAGLGGEPYIQLTRVSTSKSSRAHDNASQGTPADRFSSNAQSEQLIKDAFTAMQTNDYASAASSLQSAKLLNPEQRNLWGGFGALSFHRGEISAALPLYRKELALHPDSYWVYAPIAQVQILTKDRSGARETLHTWADLDPSNPSPTLQLTALLLEDKDAAGAVAAAEAGIARLPEDRNKDTQLQLALGGAQLKAGMQDKGTTTFLALIKSTADPLILNDSAYALGDANLELPLADSTERQAIATLTEASRGWTLDEAPLALRQKSALLVASWDTMGWILFHEGKLEDAEGFVRAAWRNRQSSVIGEHLGDIEEARAHGSEALQSYQLSLAAISTVNALGVTIAPGPDAIRIKSKISKLMKSGDGTTLNEPAKVLTGVRIYPLGAAGGRAGTAEYLLLISHGKAEKLHPSGAKTIAGAEGMIAKVDFSLSLPPGSEAKLAHAAIVNCHSAVCELILEP